MRQGTTCTRLVPRLYRVAFASNRDGNFEIYLMNADGSNQQRLTVMDADDRWPRWSPDDRNRLFEQGTT